MDGVGISIIERPRPLPGHDTPNPTHHTYTLKCEEPAKVARNLTRSFFAIGHKRCNFNDRISMSEICAWELRATLLGNQPDWKPTHETTYQHTRRRCDGRRMDRRARAGFATRRRAKRDRQVSRADGPSDAQNNAEAAAPVTGRDTRYGPLHPLRGATPVTGRDTRSEEVHCLRIGCSAPNHKNKRGICETTAETPARGPLHPLRGRCTRYGARHPIRRGALPTDRVRTQSQEQTRNLRGDRRHAQGPGSSRSRGLSTQRSANTPRRAVAAVRDGDAGGGQAIAQLVGARPVLGGAGSSPLGQHSPDQRVQRRVLGGSRTGRTRADAGLSARARQYADRDSPATRPCKTLRKPLTNQVAHSLVPACRA